MWVRPRYTRAAAAARAAAASGSSHTAAAAAAGAMGHASNTTATSAAAPTLRQVRRQGYARARPLLRAALLLLAGLAATALPVLALGAASAAAAALGATSAAAAAAAAVPGAAAAAGTPGGAAGGALEARSSGNNSSNSSSTGVNATAAQAVAPPPATAAAAPAGKAAVTSYVRLPPTAPDLTQPPDPEVWHVYGGCVPRVQNPGSPDSAPGAPGFAVYCVARAAGAAAAGAGAGVAAAGGGRNVSFWHDVPLGLKRHKASSSSSNSSSSSSGKGQEEGEEVTFWVTNEIPRGTNAKIETQTSLPYNPMMQSTLKEQRQPGGPSPPPDQLRYYRVGPSLVNYGGIPQTWEASDVPDPVTGLPSDNDPLDYLEVGGAVLPVGGVVRVRLLGALTMVDDNQTDWKMLVVNVKDPAGWRDVADLPPARRQQLYEFFRTYKVAEGKPPVTFFLPATNTTTAAAADWAGAFVGRAAAAAVLTRKHAEWRRLLAGGCSSDACAPLTAAVAAEYGPTWREQGLGQRLAAAGAGGGKGVKAATRVRGDAGGSGGGGSGGGASSGAAPGVVPTAVRKS